MHKLQFNNCISDWWENERKILVYCSTIGCFI